MDSTLEQNMDDFPKLLLAVKTASAKEAIIISTHNECEKDQEKIQNRETLVSVTLPETFGKLIALLDLQNAFLSLGRYVRSFADAAYVLEKLEELISERLVKCSDSQKVMNTISELVSCSQTYSNPKPQITP